MAAIAKSGTPSLANLLHPANAQIGNLVAGEAIAVWDACYIKQADGKVYKSTGAAADEAAEVHGYAPVAAAAGDAVTLMWDVRVRYGAGLTPGKKIYLSATAGLLVDAPTTGGVGQIGFVVDATRVQLWQSRYPEPA